MRTIHTQQITQAIEKLCVQANLELPEDVYSALIKANKDEKSLTGRDVISDLLKNVEAAAELNVPICQDTGMAVVFIELGQDVCIEGRLLRDAVNEGVRKGYLEGGLRCSVVADPLRRKNTGDNTPAILYTEVVQGENIKITVAPKGFGSENMSVIKMCNPSATREDIIDLIVGSVSTAGSMPCPPVIVGVGLGGDFEYAALLAKKALCRSINQPNKDKFYEALENDTLFAVNKLGIGPQGFGGIVTALKVNIEVYPTHIAGLPVAVNMGCHVTRHKTVIL